MFEDLITLLINIVAAIIGGFVTYRLYDMFRSRTYVKLITKSDDRDLDGFLELYEKLFDESVRISSEEIINGQVRKFL